MERIAEDIIKIEKVELLSVIMEKKNSEWRLGQACCVFLEKENIYEVSYTFCDDMDMVTYRLIVDKDETVPSISRVYKSAHFYENEMSELFGLKIEHMKVDAKDTLYRIDTPTPFLPKEDK